MENEDEGVSGILIDYRNIVRPNLTTLKLLTGVVGEVPSTKHVVGLVLVVRRGVMEALEGECVGRARVEYMGGHAFVSGVLGWSYFLYDKGKKVGAIVDLSSPEHVSVVMDVIRSGFPEDVLVSASLPVKRVGAHRHISALIREGFCDPYICKNTMLSQSFGEFHLCLSRSNVLLEKPGSVQAEVEHVIGEFQRGGRITCRMKVRVHREALSYLRGLPMVGSTENADGSVTQKEVSGRFVMGELGSDGVYEASVDQSSVTPGREEGIDPEPGLYNFHSHPMEAYERHEVRYGWPSGQDYLGFADAFMRHDTIFHAVCSLEGLYVLTMSEAWVKKRKELRKLGDFISERFDIRYKPGRTVEAYLGRVNGVEMDGKAIFRVLYFPWGRGEVSFEAFFSQQGVNCFAREETLEKYKKYL